MLHLCSQESEKGKQDKVEEKEPQPRVTARSDEDISFLHTWFTILSDRFDSPCTSHAAAAQKKEEIKKTTICRHFKQNQ